MRPIPQFNLGEHNEAVIRDILAGENGNVLIDVITDHIVLSSQLTPEQKEGAGIVLLLLRSLRTGANRIQTKPKKTNE